MPDSSVSELPPQLDDFEKVFRAYAPFVWRALGRLGVASSELADASQEVFLVVLRRLEDFEGRASLKTWIYEICLRTASGFRRRQLRNREDGSLDVDAEAPILAAASTPNAADEEVERLRARERLLRALRELDDEKRAVFVLYELEDLSMPEVADCLGCPLTTAYSRLHAARKAVRAAFARDELAVRRA